MNIECGQIKITHTITKEKVFSKLMDRQSRAFNVILFNIHGFSITVFVLCTTLM